MTPQDIVGKTAPDAARIYMEWMLEDGREDRGVFLVLPNWVHPKDIRSVFLGTTVEVLVLRFEPPEGGEKAVVVDAYIQKLR